MSQVTKWDTKLNECVSSIEDFYDYAPEIVSLLKENNPEYSHFFYKKIPQLIISKKNSPRSRFYSLYLLFKATENSDLASKTELLEDHALLTFLYRTAGMDGNSKIPFDERGKKFFSIKPTAVQERIGINFVRLSLECLINWKANYSGKSASDNLSFYVNILQKEVKFPSFYNFIDRNYCLSTDLVTWDYEKKLPVISDESLEDRVDSQPTVREINTKKTSKEAKKLKPNLEIEVVEAKLTTQPSMNGSNTTKGENSISYQMTSPLVSPNGGLRSICSSKSLLKFRPSNYNETFSRDLARINRSIERSKENTYFYKSPTREGTVERSEIESQKKVELRGFKDLLWSPKAEKESIKIKTRLNQTTVQKIPKQNVVKANREEEHEEEQSMWGKACQQRLKTLLVGYHVSVK